MFVYTVCGCCKERKNQRRSGPDAVDEKYCRQWYLTCTSSAPEMSGGRHNPPRPYSNPPEGTTEAAVLLFNNGREYGCRQ